MSRTTIRAAVQSYLQGLGQNGTGSISYLTNVYSFPAKFTKDMEFYQGEDPGIGAGCLMFLYIERENRKRIALGGAHSGKKFVTYNFVLDCFFRSTEQKTQDVGAMNDVFLDSLIAQIEADRNAGAPGTVFSWGEGGINGGTDIDIQSYYPRNLAGGASVTQIYSSIRVVVNELATT